MTDDIVARLRSPEVFIDTGGMFSPVAHEGADEIERMQNVQTSYFGMIIQLIEHAREQVEEIERLRAALFQIAHQKYGSQMNCVDNYSALQTAARAALGEASDDAAT